jgi:hypothetical protein
MEQTYVDDGELRVIDRSALVEHSPLPILRRRNAVVHTDPITRSSVAFREMVPCPIDPVPQIPRLDIPSPELPKHCCVCYIAAPQKGG